MSREKFLIDSNSLITPYRTFYSFDFSPKFWQQIGHHFEHGSIMLLDMVQDELLKGDDDLTDWLKSLNIQRVVSHRDSSVIAKYAEILQYIQNDSRYKASALNEWARESVADAWLIAAAALLNCTVITFEVHNTGLNATNPSKEAKIPDVADAFEVKTNNLYYMMRELGISL